MVTKSSNRKPDLSIIVPAYNEEKRIGRTLEELSLFLKHDTYFTDELVEVIVVAADAIDSTAEIVESKKPLFKDLQLLRPGSHVGKGRDVQFGMLHASGDYVLFMDADLATPLHHLQAFYEYCQAGNDVVIGVRNLRTYRKYKLHGGATALINVLYQLTGGVRVPDTQCGFKMFNKKATNLCFSKLSLMGWDFDMEVLAIARSNKLRIKSVALPDWQDKPFSTYTDNPLKIGIRMLGSHVKIAVNTVRGKYSRSSQDR